jgi:hypothetical protein
VGALVLLEHVHRQAVRVVQWVVHPPQGGPCIERVFITTHLQ